jgi:HD superfamily phosphohydrolase
MLASKRIRTVLYRDQRLSSAELEILHTPAMQRLYGLRQLGLTDRVFIDASHARIHHVVGVLHQVDKLISAIESSLRASNRNLRVGTKGNHQDFSGIDLANFVQKRRPVVRFIGLLHDLTHAPFGHTVEDEIGLVSTKHDEPDRQADAFYRLLCQLIAWLWVEVAGPEFSECPELKTFLSQAAEAECPDPTSVGMMARRLFSDIDPSTARACWRLSGADIAEMLAQLRCAMTALLHLEALHKAVVKERHLPRKEGYAFETAIRIALSGTSYESFLYAFEFEARRDAFMLDIVGNTVCADLLDYAQRDSHFAGLRLDYDADRIAENFTLVSFDASAYELSHPQADGVTTSRQRVPDGIDDPFEGWCLRTAISLFSHKYRTDIPSELMNLLNVRFYLYERVIYHPTKCAAGSMLGTALQLLGWRGSATNVAPPTLPAHLRFVGDDVFLHDIRASLDFVLDCIRKMPPMNSIEAADLQRIAGMDRVHNGLVPTLLGLRIGQSAGEALRELESSKMMLDRLMARRYFRPVWRALPSSTDARLQAGAEALADLFRQANTRYEAERQIEIKADLPLGTVTIHCPERTTARKIANVLLTKPGPDGDEICKLKDVGYLDGPIFGEHQRAVKAVEQMYGSMWRLTVYVAPEQLVKYNKIVEAAGQVVFKTADVHGQFDNRPEIYWMNDKNLEKEFEAKRDSVPVATPPEELNLSPLAELMGRLSDDLFKSGHLPNVPAELLGALSEISPESRARIEKALVAALSGHDEIPPSLDTEVVDERAQRLVQLLKSHSKRVKRDDVADFKHRYGPSLGKLSRESFEEIFSQMGAAVLQTGELDQQGATVHKGNNFNEFREVLDLLLRKHGLAPLPRVKNGLFGGPN